MHQTHPQEKSKSMTDEIKYRHSSQFPIGKNVHNFDGSIEIDRSNILFWESIGT